MIEQLKAKIAFLDNELHELMCIIDRGYTEANEIREEEIRMVYYEEMLPFIQDFKDVTAELKIALEEYFIEERKQQIPIDLRLHRIHKRISNETAQEE